LQLQRLLPRLGATLLGSIGVLGLLLAAIGIYGVVAYVVRQRAREIGIRLALGAPAPRVTLLLIRQGMAVCAAGALLGLAAALALTQLLGSFLYGVSTADPLTYMAAVSILMGVAFLACYLPARKATRLDVARVLSSE